MRLHTDLPQLTPDNEPCEHHDQERRRSPVPDKRQRRSGEEEEQDVEDTLPFGEATGRRPGRGVGKSSGPSVASGAVMRAPPRVPDLVGKCDLSGDERQHTEAEEGERCEEESRGTCKPSENTTGSVNYRIGASGD